MKSVSSPARTQQTKEDALESTPETPQAPKPKLKLMTWAQKGREESQEFHLQFDELGGLIVPDDNSDVVEEAQATKNRRAGSTPQGSPRKLAQQRRSLNLPKKIYVVSPPPLLPYPHQASGWISETQYSKLSREAQVMIASFSAVKELYEMGIKTFGTEWSFPIGHDEPLRNWAQRGIVKRGTTNETEYFCKRKTFELWYANGELTQHFKAVMADVSALKPGLQRTQAIRMLAKQGDHVLNLALETLYSVTLRKDYTPTEVIQAWDCMVHDQPGRKELGFIRAYLDQNCITVQAFVNASLWQFETIGQRMVPPVSTHDALNTFYFFATHFLGYPKVVLHQLIAKQKIDQHNEALQKLGAENAAAKLNELALKYKDALTLLGVAKSLEPHGEKNNEFSTEFHTVISRSKALLRKLASGDQRFANAIGLACITDIPTPVPEQVTSTQPPLTTLPFHGMPASSTVLPSLPPSPQHGNQ